MASKTKHGSVAPPGPEQLPLWPDRLRGVPWAALRSALFAPIRPGARAALERQEIASVGSYTIIYTGWRLDQADLDVYEQILHISRTGRLGEVVRFNRRDFLKSIGRNPGKSSRDWLLRSLSRLTACEIEISHEHLSYSGSLIEDHGRDEKEGVHYIRLNPKLTRLYAGHWSAITWQQRQQLGRHHLAKWLHGFIAGQRHPLTFRLSALAELADSSYDRPRDFRARLLAAAEAVHETGIDLRVICHTVPRRAGEQKITLTRDSWANGEDTPDAGA